MAGDSFGGYLSAHVDHYTLTRGSRRPDLQVLIYPATDLTHSAPSVERHAHGYLLTRSTKLFGKVLKFWKTVPHWEDGLCIVHMNAGAELERRQRGRIHVHQSERRVRTEVPAARSRSA